MFKVHGIASLLMFPWQTSAIIQEAVITSNLPYAPKQLFICVNASEPPSGRVNFRIVPVPSGMGTFAQSYPILLSG